MKFVQIKFREKQSEWLGKQGISWRHIRSVISKDTEKQTNIVTSYVHLFNSCIQDWFSVASIVEDFLQNVKLNQPNVSHAYLHSDEAGYYDNNLLVAALNMLVTELVFRFDSMISPNHNKGKTNYMSFKNFCLRIL